MSAKAHSQPLGRCTNGPRALRRSRPCSRLPPSVAVPVWAQGGPGGPGGTAWAGQAMGGHGMGGHGMGGHGMMAWAAPSASAAWSTTCSTA